MVSVGSTPLDTTRQILAVNVAMSLGRLTKGVSLGYERVVGSVLVLVALASLALLAAWTNPFLGDFGDDAEFLILGQSLATGEGYAWINSPTHPAHNRYPPGYPALLATAMLVTGTAQDISAAIVPAKLVTALLFLLSLATLWSLARRRLPLPWAAAAVALYALNPAAIRFAVQVMSDIPYVFILLLSLVWIESRIRCVPAVTESTGRKAHVPSLSVVAIRATDSLWPWLVLGVLLAVGAYVRSIGLAAAGGVLVWAWITCRGRGAVASTITFGALMLPWWLRDASLAGGWRYVEELAAADYFNPRGGAATPLDFLARAADNASFVLGKPAAFGLPGIALGGLGIALLAYGIWRSVRLAGGVGGPSEWVLAALVISILFWPIKTGRYLLPVLPLAGLYLLMGTLGVTQWLSGRLSSGRAGSRFPRLRHWRDPAANEASLSMLALAAVSLVCIAEASYGAWRASGNLYGVVSGTTPAQYHAAQPEWAHFLEAASWLRENTAPSDVVMTRRHFALYVYSGRQTEKYRFDTSEEELAYLLSGTSRKYVVEDAFDYLRGDFALLPTELRWRGGDLLLRFQSAEPTVRVWELVRPPRESVPGTR
jgi:hypothetical protein